ncbi:acetyl-CoA decarbonylase/synthase complex subunit alpha/beta [Thermincola potens]|uniref:CO-methylating acetyl-CoA synthase n=1 Tax=Thermincola potens (strain JR) TaxID=635013 RepID=D5XEF1_THEPJ|nr:acetyl-CoA decarbonylase/synthase complex subunit alpha/beta [Thermincola potens]ADG82022.1 CO dehydrogenase/acetyl-CoA synthase complex, beta subunit [Thermincola potens JR]
MSEELNFDQIYADAEKAMEGKEPIKMYRRAYKGAITAVSYAEILLTQAIKKYGKDQKIGYPNTAYFVPVIRCWWGDECTTLGDLVPVLNRARNQITEDLTFEQYRLNGMSTWIAADIIEVVQYIGYDENNPRFPAPWTGFIGDPVVRQYGIKMVDWTIPGEAVIVGRAKDSKAAAKIVADLMGKGLMIFLCDEIIEQLLEENVKLGVDYIAYPLGNFTQVVHAANYALRAGMMFGGIKPGLTDAQRDYQRRRILAFILYLGEHDFVKDAACAGAIYTGFPVITDQELPEDEQIPDWFVSCPDYDKIVQTALEVRGVKLTNIEIDIPINHGPAFEGETIRKGDMFLEMGGGRTPSFELVRMADDTIEDGKIELIGPDIDSLPPEGGRLPIGIVVDIYGRKMQPDFEPVLERRIHYGINYGEGLWHVAQRDLNWMRVSKDAYAKGFRLKHLGDLLYAKFKAEFASIVDRVQVTIYTDEQKVLEMREVAREYYRKRDARLKELTDEGVEEFYSCTLCQSFAPTHVCVVAPERVGLCGAVSWLDAKAAYEIDPHGANQPILKGECEDEVKGSWKSFNEFIYQHSQRTVEKVNFYTIMENPMTSCGCFEVILTMVPECNGFMAVNREHSGMTPCGMNFSTLAGTCGGGAQLPGFMGIGKAYFGSRKFIKADGGLARIVWMPKALKEQLRPILEERAEEDGLGKDFVDKIADETVGVTGEEILPFLEEKGHPALTMPPLL